MNNLYKIMLSLAALLCAPAGLLAQMTELEATAPVFSDPESRLIITEISFKNTGTDYLKIYYQSSGTKNINLKGISFRDDSVFKTINSDFIAPANSFIILTFKSGSADEFPDLHTTHTGLTGTTEQLIILDRDKKILDAVCWTSSTPTAAEISDQKKLYDENGWSSPDIQSCFPAETVKSNQAVARIGMQDTNSGADWKTVEPPEPGQEPSADLNNPSISPVQAAAAQQTANTAPAQTKTSPPAAKSTTPKTTAAKTPTGTKTATTKTSTTKKTSSKTTSKKYKNGGISDEIRISEILPNPDKKKEQTSEWIEIINLGAEDINLGNWQIDDKEGGSKPFIIGDTVNLAAGSVMLFDSAQSGLSLGNTGDSVRLINFSGNIIDEIGYEDAPKGQSYSLINTVGDEDTSTADFVWTMDPTPGEPNPEYRELEGTIISTAAFEQDYFFEVETGSKAPVRIIFDEDVIAGPLAKVTFTKGSQGTFLIDDGNKLVKYEITGNAPAESVLPPTLPLIALSFVIAGAAAIYFLIRKKSAPVTIHRE